jgi:hypothetical protein
VSAGARRLANAPVTVEVRIAREQRDLHGCLVIAGGVRLIAAISPP